VRSIGLRAGEGSGDAAAPVLECLDGRESVEEREHEQDGRPVIAAHAHDARRTAAELFLDAGPARRRRIADRVYGSGLGNYCGGSPPATGAGVTAAGFEPQARRAAGDLPDAGVDALGHGAPRQRCAQSDARAEDEHLPAAGSERVETAAGRLAARGVAPRAGSRRAVTPAGTGPPTADVGGRRRRRAASEPSPALESPLEGRCHRTSSSRRRTRRIRCSARA
jgi:hypothetical protein